MSYREATPGARRRTEGNGVDLQRRMLTVALLLCLPFAIAEEPEKKEAEEQVEPEDGWAERVSVRAQIEGTTSAPAGASSTRIDPTVTATPPATVTEIVAAVPGVSENGQGGIFQTVSIRGVSRQRVLNLIDGARITSERRAGVSTSFIDPNLMADVEVLRGPATTFYGSGALGGVVQVFPKRFRGLDLVFGGQGNDSERYQLIAFGGDEMSFGFAHRRADRGEAADGTVINGEFEQWSGSIQRRWQGEASRTQLTLMPSYGDEIGKPNTDFPERTTTYPRERHQLLTFVHERDSGLRINAFAHHQDLTTRVVDREAPETTDINNDSFDFGGSVEQRAPLGEQSNVRYGVSLFGRSGVTSDEQSFGEDDQGAPTFTRQRTIDGARSVELGLFSAVDWKLASSEWQSGVRYSYQDQQNRELGSDESALSGFIGVMLPVGEHWRVRANVSSGLRFPSITERFFSGTTGRGEVIGNPALDEERSLSSELGARWLGRGVLINATVFRNAIDDYIERVTVGPDLRTFVNLTEGTLEGVELHGMVTLGGEKWLLEWGGHLIEGRAADGTPLADVPPDEAFLGFSRRSGRWTLDTRLAHRFAKNDAGDGEVAIPSAEVLSATARYELTKRWSFAIRGENLLDEDYFASADDRALPARGRTLGLELRLGR